MLFHHKTIESISVTWSDKHDADVKAVLGSEGVYSSDWFSTSTPPRGSPKTGFSIRSQSDWRSGMIYIDFDNLPYFWRHDCNPEAILWKDQLPVICKALEHCGVDMDSQAIKDLIAYPSKPRDIPISPSSLAGFLKNLNELF